MRGKAQIQLRLTTCFEPQLITRRRSATREPITQASNSAKRCVARRGRGKRAGVGIDVRL